MMRDHDLAEIVEFVRQLDADGSSAGLDLSREGELAPLRAALQQHASRVAQRAELRAVQIEVERNNARRLEALTSELLRATDEKDELLAVNEHLRQVTTALERTRIELDQQTVELERSNEEFSDFSHSMAHDLRAPLRHIDAYVGIVLKEHSSELSSEGTAMLREATAAACRMHRLLDSLLLYAAVGGEIDFDVVNVHDVAVEVIADLRPLINETKARVELSELPLVKADKGLVYQALLNIVGNALKYRKPDVAPFVQLSGSCTGGAGTAGEQNCRIDVADNGIGFDSADTERIFEPFHRLEGAAGTGGAGLGLGIVAKIAARLGGHVTASSALGRGSTFSLQLPHALPIEERAGPESAPAHPYSVLVVDDDPADIYLAKWELERHGFVAATATSAEAALELMAAQAFDLVISDYEMPGHNGVWFLARVREQFPGVPCILTSGRTAAELPDSAGHEYDAFYEKPIKGEKLSAFALKLGLAGVPGQCEGVRQTSVELSPSTSSGAESGLRGLSVLVVDDDPIDFRIVSDTLSPHGMCVLTAESAEDALRMIMTEPPDLVVTDLSLPGGSGLALCEELRESHPQMPLIARTGLALPGVESRLKQLSVSVVQKDADSDVLLQAVNASLRAASEQVAS